MISNIKIHSHQKDLIVISLLIASVPPLAPSKKTLLVTDYLNLLLVLNVFAYFKIIFVYAVLFSTGHATIEEFISHQLRAKTMDGVVEITELSSSKPSSELSLPSQNEFEAAEEVKKTPPLSFLKSEITDEQSKVEVNVSDTKTSESQTSLQKAALQLDKSMPDTKQNLEEESQISSLTGDGIVATAINAIHRNNFNENPASIHSGQSFFESSKPLSSEDNFSNNQLIDTRKLTSTFNLHQLPPPPALPSASHTPATDSNINSVEMMTVRQNSQVINDQYYSHLSSATMDPQSSPASNFPPASSSSHAQITVLQQPNQQNSCPSYGTSSSSAASPSQAFITHYPHNPNESLVQSHVVHHRPNAEIEHFHQQVSMQNPVDNDPSIIHPQSIEMAHADALALQLQQPIFDQTRNMYVYQNSLVDCHGPNGLENHQLDSEMPHSSHQSASKIEINQSTDHFIGAPLQRSLSGGQSRTRKREQPKMEEVDNDIYECNQPVPDKTIEDVLKGTPGNELKKRKTDELLK